MNTTCTCNAAPAGCTAAGNFCTATGVRATCVVDANGCFAISTTKTCGSRQTCTGTLPSADCTCNAPPSGCTIEGTYCASTTSVATCAKDTDGCFYKNGSDTACGSSQTCVASGNSAACQCPAVGTTLGTGCNTVGLTACVGDTVIACAISPTSGCKTWTISSDCTANGAGLVCGTKSGTAACQCPAVTDGKYYVDPSAGSDTTTSGNFATGVRFPAACRLKSLSKAVATATTAGNKIIALSATLPATFTEAATLSVLAGVTLTTDDATPTPANYRLNYVAASGAAVALGSGSGLSGFTIANESTTGGLGNTSIAVSCATGNVTVTGVSLIGTNSAGNTKMATGLQIGGVPLNDCTGTFTNVTADGFAQGVLVSTSGASPTLTNTQVFNTTTGATGLLLQAGTVNSTDLVVQPKVAATPVGSGVIVRPASNVVAAKFIGVGTSVQGTSNDGIVLEKVVGMSVPQADLKNAVVKDATGDSSSGIRVEAGTLVVQGTSKITNSGQYGLEIIGGGVNATGLEINVSTKSGIRMEVGGTLAIGSASTVTKAGQYGLEIIGGTLGATDLTVTDSAKSGIRMEAGNHNITGSSSITGAGQYGLEIIGGTLTSTGLTVAGATNDGVHVTGGSVVLHQITVKDSHNNNVWMDNGTILIDNGSKITGATGAGIVFAGATTDRLDVGNTGGGIVEIANNGGHGISLAGTGGAGPVITVQRTNVHDNNKNGIDIANTNANASVTVSNTVEIANNGGHGIGVAGTGGNGSVISVQQANVHDNNKNGIDIALTNAGSSVTVANSTVSANKQNGVVVTAAPSNNATDAVKLDTVDVSLHASTAANTGRGIWLHGNDAASGDITATILNCKVHGNAEAGIVIDEDMPAGHTTTTRETLRDNDVYSNNMGAAAAAVGGIWFATSSNLTAFTGNKIHSNGKDQIAFTAARTGGGNWVLDAGTTACTATPSTANRIYCYDTATAYGLRTTNPAGAAAYTVDADHVAWSHATPSNANHDFAQGPTTTITVANACAAVTTCP